MEREGKQCVYFHLEENRKGQQFLLKTHILMDLAVSFWLIPGACFSGFHRLVLADFIGLF